MKAWLVWDKDDEWAEIIFAETAGKAKVKIHHEFSMEDIRYAFTQYRTKRLPWLDGEVRAPTGLERISHDLWCECARCHGQLWPPDAEEDKEEVLAQLVFDKAENAYHRECFQNLDTNGEQP